MNKFIKSLVQKLRGNKQNEYMWRSGWELGSNMGTEVAYTFTQSPTQAAEKKEDTRIVKKPVEVYKEIVSETPDMNLVGLDSKIKLVEKRIRVMKEVGGNLGDENEALGFLRARKQYLKHKGSFSWAVTNLSMIDALIKKYKLSYVDFSSYSRNVPGEAIDELEKFGAVYNAVRDDQPVLKLIIDSGGKEQKKDPILLASSPFGKWFYILGAWDKEVEIVDDLVYNGK